MEITGQQILDALEWGARYTTGVPGSPDNGAFLHAAGLTYKIDTTITSTVQSDETGLWTGAPTGEYRVYDVTVYDKTTATYKPLELDGTYTVGGINYTLLDQGDGFDMFRGGTVINENVMVDIDALVAYIEAFADSNGDTVPDLTTANSPLSTWENYKMNYESPIGGDRLVFAQKPVVEEGGEDGGGDSTETGGTTDTEDPTETGAITDTEDPAETGDTPSEIDTTPEAGETSPITGTETRGETAGETRGETRGDTAGTNTNAATGDEDSCASTLTGMTLLLIALPAGVVLAKRKRED